ncbi:hypothetical protein [Streptomyces bottropensis]|uniref:hypothetical protein n=1 Tax=Streptomyces bottropensis TaxID=42235 RepID=UPI0036CF4B9F
MNLNPGESIDVGVTRSPAPVAPEPAAAPRLDPAAITMTKIEPGTVVTLADVAAVSPPPVPRLDATFFADKERVLAMTAHWSRDELYALGNALMGEGDRRIEPELLAVLRDMCPPNPDDEDSPTHVEFVTNANYDDGMYWDDESVYVHINGEAAPIDFENPDDDAELAAQDERFRDLLADYSRSDPPADGAHLIVDLATGEFERSGKWSLV